ncbi:hypothetical protein F4778DRAFT_781784 [Xylariomycetidae sp. FL2044]|nr:hypothetical protein F4778DRAFT_781784 [Xylariomycetidae sp. FL2044]
MTTKPKISILQISDDSDIPATFGVLSRAFGHDAPFVDIYFPAHDTSPGQAQGVKRLTAWKRGSAASTTFLKAVVVARSSSSSSSSSGSEENDEEEHVVVVGLAVWTHMTEAPPADLVRAEGSADVVREVWPDEGGDREFMARLWREYVVPRTRAIAGSGGKGVYVLELLAVDPEYQGKGAGTALVEWGTGAADRQGIKSIVEATPAGRRVYEKCGLRAEIEEMQFDVGDEFSERTKPKLVFMTREPQS